MQSLSEFIHPFLLNAALILLVASAHGPICRGVRAPMRRQVVLGGLFGLMAIGCMSAPMVLGPGMFVDLRAAAAMLAGPFGGPLAALVAGLVGAGWRLWLGGMGAVDGAATVVLAALLGLGLYYWLGQLDTWRKALIAGLLLVLAPMLPFLRALHDPEIVALMLRLALPLVVALPLTILLASSLLMREERHRLARAALARSETRLRQVVHVASDWFWETGPDLRFTGLEGHAISDAARAALIGKRREEVALDPSSPELRRHLEEMTRRRVFRDFRHAVVPRPGGPRHVSVSGAPFFDEDGAFLGYVGSGRDVTAEVENQQALDEARREAVAASEAKSAFLANMSHEIRTPMTGMLGMLDILETTRLDREQTDVVRKVRASAATLLAIVNDILDLSKIEAGSLQIEQVPFDLRLALETACAGPAAAARAKGLGFALSVAEKLPRTALGDGHRIAQVIINFLSNAVRFTETGRIDVRVTPEAGGVAFAVADTGIGIAAEKIEHIFRPFEQADASTTRRFGGTGLGLAICARLAKAMGGTTAVESAPGKGSTFTLHLPLTFSADEERAPEAAGRDGPVLRTSARLLVAEDNDVNALLLKTMLTRRGYAVTMVGNGAEAVAAAATGAHDIVMLDMHMPVMDGLEATRRIRALPPPLCDLPVFALTADALHQNRSRYAGIGLTEFLTKPIDWEALDRAIARHAPPRASDVAA